MQLICETLFPPRTSVTIRFLTYSSYTLQSIAVVTTATFIPVYLFIARQSRNRMSGVTHQNLIGYISAIWLMSNVMATQPNVGGALCENSVNPFLVPHRKFWLMPAAAVTCSNTDNIGELKTWTQSEFCSWQNSVRRQEPPQLYI